MSKVPARRSIEDTDTPKVRAFNRISKYLGRNRDAGASNDNYSRTAEIILNVASGTLDGCDQGQAAWFVQEWYEATFDEPWPD